MARLDVDVRSSGIESVKRKITDLDTATENLRLENIKLKKELKSLDKTAENYAEEEKRLTAQIVGNTVATKANRREQQELQKQINATKGGVSTLAKVFGGLSVALIALKLKDFTVEVVGVGVELESLKASLNASVGSAKEGATAFKFLTAEADRLGQSVISSVKGFKELSASAKGTAIDGEQVKNIFRAVSEAGAVMQLTTDDLNGTFRALSQIMSKGTVQAEELRGQLGERIPGAFQIASRAMGVTTQELNKMLQQGQVISDDFLPKFAKELQNTFSSSLPASLVTARAEFQRLNNEILLTKETIANSGLTEFAKQLAIVSTAVVKAVGLQIESFETGAEAGAIYANSIISGLNAIIEGTGFVYDAFQLLRIPLNALLVAVGAIATPILGVFALISEGIENTVNEAIKAVNLLIELVSPALEGISRATGIDVTISKISKVDIGLTSISDRLFEASQNVTAKALSDIADAYSNVGSGAELAQGFIGDVASQFSGVKSKNESIGNNATSIINNIGSNQGSGNQIDLQGQAVDVIGAIQDNLGQFGLQDLKRVQDVYKENDIIFQDLQQRIESFNPIVTDLFKIVEDAEKPVEEATDSFKDYIDTVIESDDIYTVTTGSASKLNDAIQEVKESAEELTIQFQQGLFKSFESSLSSIQNIISITSGARGSIFGSSGYQESLQRAQLARQASISSPLDAKVAQEFNDAVSELNQSVSGYLDPNNFASTKDYQLAQLSVANQLESFGETANVQEILLEQIADLIEGTNTALDDGILTDSEISSINQGSQDIIATNTELLGQNGAVATAIETQDYYDNAGLAKDTSLVGTNSVTSVLEALSGAKSIADIVNSSNSIATATGLVQNEVINVKTNTGRIDDKTKENANTWTVGHAQIGYKKERVGTDTTVVGDVDNWRSWESPIYQIAPTFGQIRRAGQDSGFHSGGFTGTGGKYEEAGPVHKGEYVVNQRDLRAVGGVGAVEQFINSQGQQPQSRGFSMPNNRRLEFEMSELKGYVKTLVTHNIELTRLVRNVTQGGTLMQTELVQ